MTEASFRSRLKRKKSSVEELQSDQPCPKNDIATPALTVKCSSISEGQLVDASVWWSRARPPAVDGLWAFALKSAITHNRDQQSWDRPTELPQPHAVGSVLVTSDDRWVCDLTATVAPLPEPSSPTLPPPTLDSFPQHSTAPCGRPGRTMSALISNSPTVVHQPPPSAAAINNDRSTPVIPHSLEDDEVEEKITVSELKGDPAGAGRGVGGLQCCPMCLKAFPNGCTQMERDGHLAQCLSEMNVDVTW